MPDISDGTTWSELDPSNNRAPPNGWPEGMMPSGVNDAARMNMGALKRFWNRANAVQAITPSAGVWTFTTDNPTYPTGYVDGEVYSFRPAADGAAADQFQVNALGGKPIWKRIFGAWAPVAADDIQMRCPARLVYDSTLNGGAGAFVLADPFVPIQGTGGGGVSVPGNLSVGGAYIYFGAGTTPHIYADSTNMAWQLGSGNGSYTWLNSVGAPLATLGNDGHLTINGPFTVGAYIYFDYSQPTPHMYVDTTNMVWQLGSGNGSWQWFNNAGTITAANLTSTGNLTLAGPYLRLNGSTGTVNGAGGPLIYGDSTNLALKLGGSGSFLFQNVSGTSVANIDGSGDLTLGGNLTLNGLSWQNSAGFMYTPQSLICQGSFQANATGTAISAHNGDISANGSLLAGGCRWYNSGGLMRTPNGLIVDGGTSLQAVTSLGHAVTGNITATGDISATSAFRSSNGRAGAQIENFPGSAWSAVSFGLITGGYLGVSADQGINGFNYAPNSSWSDARLKENIRLTEVDALAALLATPVHSFDWNEDGRKRMPSLPEHIRVGLIAQEVEETMPEVVHTLPELDDMRMIRDDLITPYLVRALQQLAARLTALEAK